MKNTINQVFHSPKFLVGFIIFAVILLTMIIYPLINPGDPLAQIGLNSFTTPGTYVSTFDAITTKQLTFKLPEAEAKRLAALLSDDERDRMLKWFSGMNIDLSDVDTGDKAALIEVWLANFEEGKYPEKTISADRKAYVRLNKKLLSAASTDTFSVTETDATGATVDVAGITSTDYVKVGDVANTIDLPLGTDNFGRDTLKELVSACGTSLMIGLIAGVIATLIGLIFGLLSGYVGGVVDDVIMFITNLFTVIPGFILLILISYSIGQEQRGATTVAVVIGLTAWTWTARSVRSQVISLRNRDHVNLSKLSGHSLVRIILTDILPYIASYVVMAFILQVSSGILAEAQLSMLGLGPKTTEVPTLGLMMNWAMLYAAHLNGSWWAYFPVILTIALISFSLNLMNTGLDQVFNPTLRD